MHLNFVATVVMAVAASASAATINFTENFNGAANTDPAGFSDGAGKFAQNGSGQYVTTNADSPPPNVIYTPFAPAAGAADYTVSATFTFVGNTTASLKSAGGSPTAGVIARYQNSTNFYEARVDGDSFDIIRRAASPVVYGAVAIDLTTNVSYTISLTVDGSQLSATLLGSDGTNKTISPLTDTSYTSGSAGLRGRPTAGVTTAATSVAFDSFSIVPEPASLGVIGAAALGLLRRRR